VSHRFHLLFSTQSLIAARCDRCYKLVAVYEEDTACPECQTTGGVWRSEGRCGCGIPQLAEGSKLAELLARARRARPGAWRRAPVTVRVTCGAETFVLADMTTSLRPRS
jgi:hypothetical protein